MAGGGKSYFPFPQAQALEGSECPHSYGSLTRFLDNTDYLKVLCKSYAYTMEAYGNIRILFEKDYLSLYLSLNTEYPKETLLIHYGGL